MQRRYGICVLTLDMQIAFNVMSTRETRAEMYIKVSSKVTMNFKVFLTTI